jgi:hypothetical protein
MHGDPIHQSIPDEQDCSGTVNKLYLRCTLIQHSMLTNLRTNMGGLEFYLCKRCSLTLRSKQLFISQIG